MGVLADHQILDRVKIIPAESSEPGKSLISYGVSSYGYDIRLGTRFKIYRHDYKSWVGIIDPKKFDENLFVTIDTEQPVIVPPNSFALAESLEYIEVPRDMIAIVVGKSTYARCGIIVNVTPLEPEWRGIITIEISNTTPAPARIYPKEGIAQVLFLKGEDCCRTSYADKKGKYQDQKGITLPVVI